MPTNVQNKPYKLYRQGAKTARLDPVTVHHPSHNKLDNNPNILPSLTNITKNASHNSLCKCHKILWLDPKI